MASRSDRSSNTMRPQRTESFYTAYTRVQQMERAIRDQPPNTIPHEVRTHATAARQSMARGRYQDAYNSATLVLQALETP